MKKYEAFLNLPEKTRKPVEENTIFKFVEFYNQGYSISLSIAKTSKAMCLARTLAEKIIRSNQALKEILKAHREAQLNSPRGLR
jgi:hypothetical protein